MHIEIPPVAVDRISGAFNGRRVWITADAGMVVQRLQEIDDRVHVWYSIAEQLYMVELHTPMPDGSVEETLFGAYDQLDARVENRLREASSPGYDLAAELEKREAEADREHQDQMDERMGDAAERLAHAFQKDLGRHEIDTTPKSRAVVPKDLPKDAA
jgi:hypothetical protein